MTTLVLDLHGLLGAKRRLDSMARADLEPLYEAIGASLESAARERIGETKKDPDGDSWKGWSEGYQRPAKGGILQLNGDLIDSIAFETTKDSIVVGSNMVYALTHQEGDKDRGIPRRAYLGVSEEDLDDLQAMTVDFLLKGFSA